MPVLPNTLDANVNNPNRFPSFSGGRKTRNSRKIKKTRNSRKMRRTRKYHK